MNSTEEKRRLRNTFALVRGAVKSAEKDEAIMRHFLSFFSEERNFFIYCSFRTEVETSELIAELLKRDKTVCVPKTLGREMIAVPYSDKQTKNGYGISEPETGEDTPCAVVVAPLLAVDNRGNRLGYGGGYYDRYFRLHPNALRVGICYAAQVTERLPVHEGDVPLHAVVTEEGVRFFGE